MPADQSIFSSSGLPFEDGLTYRAECEAFSRTVHVYRQTATGWDFAYAYGATSTDEADVVAQIGLWQNPNT